MLGVNQKIYRVQQIADPERISMEVLNEEFFKTTEGANNFVLDEFPEAVLMDFYQQGTNYYATYKNGQYQEIRIQTITLR